ncbi:MAG: hypothetical protein KKB22_06265 [Candidatus Omnitrophica bacterium]|nr:hypothetical protein [Candidatus Omnitrophota bacterium]
MLKDSVKNSVKKELKCLLKSMDFISNNFLNREDINKGKLQIYFNIYQQLGLTWEFLALQCKHWDGYKKVKSGMVCRTCGKVKDTHDFYYLIPEMGFKKIGKMLKPSSQKSFNNKRKAQILNDTIEFHGALLNVDVHNSYKSNLLKGKNEINIAAERNVMLKEQGIKCYIDGHLINVELNNKGRKVGKKIYGNFPWEIKGEKLKKFPVIFDFDESYKLLGLTILT